MSLTLVSYRMFFNQNRILSILIFFILCKYSQPGRWNLLQSANYYPKRPPPGAPLGIISANTTVGQDPGGLLRKRGDGNKLIILQNEGFLKGRFFRDGTHFQIHYRPVFTLVFKLSIQIFSANQKISVSKYTHETLLIHKYCTSCNLLSIRTQCRINGFCGIVQQCALCAWAELVGVGLSSGFVLAVSSQPVSRCTWHCVFTTWMIPSSHWASQYKKEKTKCPVCIRGGERPAFLKMTNLWIESVAAYTMQSM